MTPDQVRALTASLEAAVRTNNDDASAEIAMQLCCGVALNLALIAERLQASECLGACPPG